MNDNLSNDMARQREARGLLEFDAGALVACAVACGGGGSAPTTSDGKMFFEQVLQAVGAQGPTSGSWKDRIRRLTAPFSQPRTQNCNGLSAKRSTSCLPSFAQALRVRACTQHDVLAAQADHL